MSTNFSFAFILDISNTNPGDAKVMFYWNLQNEKLSTYRKTPNRNLETAQQHSA
jgi:hypothetical protein